MGQENVTEFGTLIICGGVHRWGLSFCAVPSAYCMCGQAVKIRFEIWKKWVYLNSIIDLVNNCAVAMQLISKN